MIKQSKKTFKERCVKYLNRFEINHHEKVMLIYLFCDLLEQDCDTFDREKFLGEIKGFEEYCWRINMMSRRLFIEPKDTPICCSPASETYWSM